MRFATIRTQQGTTAARLDGDLLIPLACADVGEMLVAGGTVAERERPLAVPAAEADFAPVVTRPGKVICVGLNYRAHILETGRELPQYPTLFAKFAETLLGARDDLVLPSVSECPVPIDFARLGPVTCGEESLLTARPSLLTGRRRQNRRLSG